MARWLDAVVATLVAGCAAGCFPEAKPPSELSAGERIYRERCGRCHDLVPPGAYTPAQWRGVLGRMQPYAALTEAERAAIEAWITTAGD